MFKFYRSVLAAGVVALGLAACGDNVTVTNPPPVTAVVHSVTVVPASQTMNVGQAGVTFVASVNADSGKVTTVSWTSTNQAVATISAAGLITALAPGQTTIVATSTADPTKTGAGSLNVVALPPNIVAFSVTPSNGSIAVAGTLQGNYSVTLTPGAPAATIAWTSSNSNIASVNAAGTITGVSAGAAIITATATSGTQTATATIGVTVGTGPTGVISFSVTPGAMTLFATQSQVATATVSVAPTFTAPAVVWTSLAPTVATVVGSGTGGVTGTITAVAQGTAIITATIGTGAQTLTQNVVVTVGQGASISIASVTAGATAGTIAGCAGIANTPVILTNVNCQIDVNMNLNAGVQPLDSLVVRMKQPSGFKTLAKQNYGNTIPSSGLVTLSINTANFVKNPAAGTTTVDLYNGPTNLLTQVYPHVVNGGSVTNCQVGAADATCAVINSMVLNNADGWAADIQKCSGGTGVIAAVAPTCAAAAPSTGTSGASTGTNTSTGGFANDVGGNAGNVGLTYWGGPTGSGQTTAELYAVIYNDNPTFPSGAALNRCNNTLGNGTGCINSVTWSVGIPVPATFGNTPATAPGAGQWCAAVTQTTLPFRRTFGTGTGSTSSCANYENVTTIRDNIDVTAAIDGVNNPYVLVGTLICTPPAAGGCAPAANPNFTLIPNTVVFGSTPDSARYDYKFSGTVSAPSIVGAEGQNWVNQNWLFGTGTVSDAGVGPAAGTWASFCSNAGTANSNCAQGGSATFTTTIVTGNDPVMVETNTKTSDAYTAIALGADRLGNGSNSGAVGTFGVDRTSPLLRVSFAGSPSYSAGGTGIYLNGGASGTAVLDSTVYNAIETSAYAVNVATVGARQHFMSAAYGTGDSVRVDAIDGRSGLRRAIANINRFSQNGGTGSNTSVRSYNTTFFLPGTVDGWLPDSALHVLNGAVGTGAQAVSGYYTTTMYVVDNAGNVSGCPTTGAVSGSVCTASTASTTALSNPAMVGANINTPGVGNANLFARRTLALDIGQPAVTGVSPNNNYTGNSPQTWTLGAQDDLEVIDARFRVQYPNLTVGTVGAGGPGVNETPATNGGLVWSYALSNTFMATGFSGGPASNAFAPATAAAGVNAGFFSPVGIRFDGAVNALPGNGAGIVNPLLKPVSLDLFTLNVQETCTNAAPPGTGFASGQVVATACNAGMFVGDPIPTSGAGSIALAKPTNVAVQVRDVFGSWVFNDNPGSATTGVSAEFISPILSATVAAPGGYGVAYFSPSASTSCPAGGAVQAAASVTCVTGAGSVNFRGDLFYTPTLATTTKVYRSTEALSNTLPVFTRVEMYGLNALGQWVFISRITVPQGIGAIPVSAGCPATAAGLTVGSVQGCDNGNERYWFFTFSSAGSSFLAYRAIGVNSSGFGLASTIN